jgi:catechol 2,3-dioxygenase-like lactoylglutathione lyase family enzyme
MRHVLRLHHVNLSIPVDGADAEAAFLVDYLNYRRMELTPGTPPQAKWFEGDDGTQIHLSEDPEHHPSTRAHVAVDLGDGLHELRSKFDTSDYEYRTFDGPNGPTLFCQDPAGNRWELRGNLVDRGM